MELRATVHAVNKSLADMNNVILIVKEQAEVGSPAVLEAHLEQLRAVKARYSPDISALCDEYLSEKAAKVATERSRDAARAALGQYRQNIFPGYQIAINEQLRKFNACWSLSNVSSTNTRGGSSCTYDVVINNSFVPIAGVTAAGTPTFRSALSAGDRNTLALSFFFASLDQDSNIANKIVVIDDPLNSLDEHRTLNTVREIIRLTSRVQQVIVLSHDKSFLCRIWEGADQNNRIALEVIRNVAGSTVAPWDVTRDSVTEHNRRHALMNEYLGSNTNNQREVARCIRPTLEAFFRTACPIHFPPGTLLGQFRNRCQRLVSTNDQILDQQSLDALRDIVDYANRFHHDTNIAWETELINDQELADFVRRTLNYTRAR
jgi:wobble nucleotide-excising tRNase